MFLIVKPWSFYSTAAFKQGNLQGKAWYFFVSRWYNFASGTATGWKHFEWIKKERDVCKFITITSLSMALYYKLMQKNTWEYNCGNGL